MVGMAADMTNASTAPKNSATSAAPRIHVRAAPVGYWSGELLPESDRCPDALTFKRLALTINLYYRENITIFKTCCSVIWYLYPTSYNN
jgi:hypothetical protein